MAIGGTLEDRPRYQKSHCFDKFPFPILSRGISAQLTGLGERLDRHRKEVLIQHNDLTITRLYNVLERVRQIERMGTGTLTDKERDIFDRGLVGVLREIHNEIDDATFDAYGWAHDIGENDILENLVNLNAERAAEEARGLIRWLRPEFQDPNYGKERAPERVQEEMVVASPITAQDAARTLPKELPERIAVIRDVLADHGGIVEVRDIARLFKGRKGPAVREALDALVALGLAESADDIYAFTDSRLTNRAA
ncbi:MAG: hypothetical protein GY791_12895 [Alphaproteobacteria bacterium]|nr:hypothetical protein [Alphaproteobacteria bacterium]